MVEKLVAFPTSKIKMFALSGVAEAVVITELVTPFALLTVFELDDLRAPTKPVGAVSTVELEPPAFTLT